MTNTTFDLDLPEFDEELTAICDAETEQLENDQILSDIEVDLSFVSVDLECLDNMLETMTANTEKFGAVVEAFGKAFVTEYPTLADKLPTINQVVTELIVFGCNTYEAYKQVKAIVLTAIAISKVLCVGAECVAKSTAAYAVDLYDRAEDAFVELTGETFYFTLEKAADRFTAYAIDRVNVWVSTTIAIIDWCQSDEPQYWLDICSDEWGRTVEIVEWIGALPIIEEV